VDSLTHVIGTLGFMIDFDGNGGWDFQSSVSPELDGSRIETISASGNDGTYWTFGIEGHGLRWSRARDFMEQFREARIEYEMAVAITFGQGFGTIVIPELDPHAISANLKFAQPSDAFTMGNISMVKHVYNLNNITWQPQVEPPTVPETSSTSWGWWLFLLLIILVVVAYVIGRFAPESMPGRHINRTAEAVGVTKALAKTKEILRKTIRGVKGKVKKDKPGGPEVVKAEVVAEEPSPTDS
jgi:Na+-transporting methylmalonyl-CoA/oxaloacetate decarboxylase gamma subunit